MSLKQYLLDTKAEMKHVTWPTKSQAIGYTVAVVVISIITSALLGGLDFLGRLGLGALLNR
jgi:preprotein translocase SecE subunit